MAETRSTKVKLDWSRLLGFDQALETRDAANGKLSDPRLNKAGAKFGAKTGAKLGVKFAGK